MVPYKNGMKCVDNGLMKIGGRETVGRIAGHVIFSVPGSRTRVSFKGKIWVGRKILEGTFMINPETAI